MTTKHFQHLIKKEKFSTIHAIKTAAPQTKTFFSLHKKTFSIKKTIFSFQAQKKIHKGLSWNNRKIQSTAKNWKIIQPFMICDVFHRKKFLIFHLIVWKESEGNVLKEIYGEVFFIPNNCFFLHCSPIIPRKEAKQNLHFCKLLIFWKICS